MFFVKFRLHGQPSALDTTKYARLNQDPCDNEEEDDVLFRDDGVTARQSGNTRQKKVEKDVVNGTAPNVEVLEMARIIPAPSKKSKASGDVEVRLAKTGMLSRTRVGCFVATVFVGLVLGFGIVFILPYWSPSKLHPLPSVNMQHSRSPGWKKTYHMASESFVHLLDIDEDGAMDILLGLLDGDTLQPGSEANPLGKSCHENGLQGSSEVSPCQGQVVGVRGSDGTELWKVFSAGGVKSIVCPGLDVNQDGKSECLAAGQRATLLVINPLNGSVLWEGDQSALVDSWSVQSPLLVPDLDKDGIPEVLVVQGVESRSLLHRTSDVAEAGRLLLLSGATGKLIGRHLPMPEGESPSTPPVIHMRRDGSKYVMFGTSSEDGPGGVYIIALPTLYRYVMHWNTSMPVDVGSQGSYKKWGRKRKMKCNKNSLCQLYRNSRQGVLVPPVCVDITGDKVTDILVSAADGTVTLFNGQNLHKLWMANMSGYEITSVPAPGHFNDDNVTDFMLQANQGQWPVYDKSQTVVLDGLTGKLLWNVTAEQSEQTSPLVLRRAGTKGPHEDLFLFHSQGIMANISNASSQVLPTELPKQRAKRAVGRQYYPRPQNPTNDNGNDDDYVDPNQSRQYPYYQDYGGTNYGGYGDVESSLWDSSEAQRAAERAAYHRLHECDEDRDLTGFTSQVLMFHPTSPNRLYLLSEQPAETLFYNLTGPAVISHEEQCSILYPEDRSTGAIGDMDGDGSLDLAVVFNLVSLLHDDSGDPLEFRFDTKIVKLNLLEALDKHEKTKANGSAVGLPNIGHSNANKMKVLAAEDQPWAAYMGSKGDAVYHTKDDLHTTSS